MKRVSARKDQAVSPIIGTVLLIAITVTLAASLFTVLGSYFSNLPQASPSASLKIVNSTVQKNSAVNGSYILSVTSISNNISLDHVKVEVTMNSTEVYVFPLYSVENTPGGSYTIFNGTSGNMTAKYSGTQGYLTSSSSIAFTETNCSSFIEMVSIIDTTTDSSMGSITVVS